MGANVSQRSGKCLKNRRSKSEECLGSSKGYLKYNMGRFFAPWHHFTRENIANNNQETINTTRYFTYADWAHGKDRIAAMNAEKNFGIIRRTNSLDKSDYEMDFEKLKADSNFAANGKSSGSVGDGVDAVDGERNPRERLTIDVNKGWCTISNIVIVCRYWRSV